MNNSHSHAQAVVRAALQLLLTTREPVQLQVQGSAGEVVAFHSTQGNTVTVARSGHATVSRRSLRGLTNFVPASPTHAFLTNQAGQQTWVLRTTTTSATSSQINSFLRQIHGTNWVNAALGNVTSNRTPSLPSQGSLPSLPSLQLSPRQRNNSNNWLRSSASLPSLPSLDSTLPSVQSSGKRKRVWRP